MTEKPNRMGLALARNATTQPKAAAAPAPRVKPVRLTLEMDPDLHRRLKVYAAEQGVSIADLIRGWTEKGLADQ